MVGEEKLMWRILAIVLFIVGVVFIFAPFYFYAIITPLGWLIYFVMGIAAILVSLVVWGLVK